MFFMSSIGLYIQGFAEKTARQRTGLRLRLMPPGRRRRPMYKGFYTIEDLKRHVVNLQGSGTSEDLKQSTPAVIEKPLLHIWTFKTPFSQHITSNVFQIIHISIETVWTIIFFFTFILFFSCF